ncbi:hypothetical protein [Streptomyces sp.]|uniref:hypothetical protein n=1 Tax=Streptomyces sp. TaxID=1931 RepID=UPI002811A089|nr:hypothetical protein [Streptomyces sp.]
MSNEQQYDPYGRGHGYGAENPAEVTQTWEGQTWDTQYQPAVRPQDPAPAPPEAPAAYGPGTPAPAAYGPGTPAPAAYGPGTPAPAAYGPGTPAPASYGTQAPASYDTAHLPPQQYGQPQPGQGYVPQPYAQQYEPYAEPYRQAQAPSFPQPQAHAPGRAPDQPPYAEAPAQPPVEAPAPVPGAGPAYSAPTTSGNLRVTDAQRARAEGRSPVIEPGMQPAALTAVLSLLLAGGAALGTYGPLVPLVLLQGLTAAGWFRLNGMWPARQGIALAFLGGLVSDAVLLTAGREHAAAAILGTLGVWVLLCLVLQLRSHADPDERVYGLMATVASAALTIVATGHLGSEADAVTVGGVAVAVAVLARALPLPGPVSLVVALLAAAGGGVAAGELTGLGASGALLGLAAGVCALIGLRVASYDYPSRFVHMTAGIALPLTAAAPAVYLLGRALV